MLSAAAQSQPEGRALPPLVTGWASTPGEHVTLALKIDPFKSALEDALPDRAKFIAHKCTAQATAVIRQRCHAVEELEEISKSLDRFREPWYERLPAGSPARNVNLPLIHLISCTVGYPDVNFARDLALGMPIVGTIPDSNVLTERARGITATFEEWKKGIPSRNKEVVERAKKYQEHELASARWAKTLGEIKAGWVSEPVPINDVVLGKIPLTPRFAAQGKSNAKIRLIGDFSASGINDIVETNDTDAPENLDTMLALANFYYKLNPDVSLQAFAVDFQHAYKNVPMRRHQGEFAQILLSLSARRRSSHGGAEDPALRRQEGSGQLGQGNSFCPVDSGQLLLCLPREIRRRLLHSGARKHLLFSVSNGEAYMRSDRTPIGGWQRMDPGGQDRHHRSISQFRTRVRSSYAACQQAETTHF